ncbi:probable ubiquitin conjugation factor E4 [Tanacetum coccineum]
MQHANDKQSEQKKEEQVEAFDDLSMDALAILGGIPDEFLDFYHAKQLYTQMKDPVILPSSRIVIDRPVIQRLLFSDPTDPFNRSHLTTDMLIPDIELKQKIEEFVMSQQRKQHGDGLSMQSNSKSSILSPDGTRPLID